jgi:hypothetical protein
MADSSREVRRTVDWRRVVVLAVVMALAIVLVWKAWERRLEHREQLAAEPLPAPPPVTDVSAWESRIQLFHNREMVADMLDLDDRLMHQDELIVDRCGSPRYSGHSPDEIRLTFLDTWVQHAFTVHMEQQGAGAVATWHRVVMNPPPPDPSRPVATHNDKTRHSGMFRIESPTKRGMDAPSWQRALGAVRDPAFSRLDPGATSGLDGFSLTVESCTGNRYHLVDRWSPGDPGDRVFLRTVRSLVREAGAVHDIPVFPGAYSGDTK